MSRVNIWIVIAILLVLFAVTRYVMHEREISHICANDPSAPSVNAEGRSRPIEKPSSPFYSPATTALASKGLGAPSGDTW